MVVLGLVVLGVVHSRFAPSWEWSVIGIVALGMVVLGLVQVPIELQQLVDYKRT